MASSQEISEHLKKMDKEQLQILRMLEAEGEDSWQHIQGMYDEDVVVDNRSTLQRLDDHVKNRRKEENKRIEVRNTKDQAARAHSQYLQGSAVCPSEMRDARYAAAAWAKKHHLRAIDNFEAQSSRRTRASSGQPQVPLPSAPSNQQPNRCPRVVPSRRQNVEVEIIPELLSDDEDELLPLSTAISSRKQTSSRSAEDAAAPSGVAGSSDAEVQLIDLCNSPTVVSTSTPQMSGSGWKCPIMNCEARFDDGQKYEDHMHSDWHPPCQPMLDVTNVRINYRKESKFMCAECRRIFKTLEGGLQHIEDVGHNLLAKPLRVGAYICPQCFYIFPSLETCQAHIIQKKHTKLSYVFRGEEAVSAHPVAMPVLAVRRYLDACMDVPWNIECLTCNTRIKRVKTSAHIAENPDHQLLALTSSSCEDIFMKLISCTTCVTCLRIFSELPRGGLGSIHRCGQDEYGICIENDCTSFSEFVCRLGLPSNKEIEVVDLSSPVVSGNKIPPDTGQVVCATSASAVAAHEADQTAQPPTPKKAGSHTRKRPLRDLMESDISSGDSKYGSCPSRTDPSQPMSPRKLLKLDLSDTASCSKVRCVDIVDEPDKDRMASGLPVIVDDDSPAVMDDLNSSYRDESLIICSDVDTSDSLPTTPRDSAEVAQTVVESHSSSPVCMALRKQVSDIQVNCDINQNRTSHVSAGALVEKNSAQSSNSQNLLNVTSKLKTEDCLNVRESIWALHLSESFPEELQSQTTKLVPSDTTCKHSILSGPSSSAGQSLPVPSDKSKRNALLSIPRTVTASMTSAPMKTHQDVSSCVSEPVEKAERNSLLSVPRPVTASITGGPTKTYQDVSSCVSEAVEKSVRSSLSVPRPVTVSKPLVNLKHPTVTSVKPSKTLAPAYIPLSSTSRASVVKPSKMPSHLSVPTTSRAFVEKPSKTPSHLSVPTTSRTFVEKPSKTPSHLSVPTTTCASVEQPKIPSLLSLPTISHASVEKPKIPSLQSVPTTSCVSAGMSSKSSAVPPPQVAVVKPTSTLGPSTTEPVVRRPPSSVPSDDVLLLMRHIIFLDLDNWACFFRRLPFVLPAQTFVWAFHGGASQWKEPTHLPAFKSLKRDGCFYLHQKCGRTKNAADFALVIWVAKMDEKLPDDISFTILSGDNGFNEITTQLNDSTRRTVVINPHHQDDDMVFAKIKSVGE